MYNLRFLAFGGVSKRFQLVLASLSLYSLPYIIPQSRALESRSPADCPKESSHKFTPKDPIRVKIPPISTLIDALTIASLYGIKVFPSIAVERLGSISAALSCQVYPRLLSRTAKYALTLCSVHRPFEISIATRPLGSNYLLTRWEKVRYVLPLRWTLSLLPPG